jgi:hypothetical protein
MILAPITPSEPIATLADLEHFAEGQERSLGPLVDIGNDGINTVLTFDMSDPPPDALAILRPTPGGHAQPVDGYRLVCQGNGIVGGQLTGIAAFRAEHNDAPQTVKPDSALVQTLAAELATALSYRDIIAQTAASHGLPAAIVAGLGSQESGWGTSALLHPNGPSGTGDNKPRPPKPPLRPATMPTDGLGFGRGLMQIDWDAHQFARTGEWRDPQANIAYCCSLLADDRDRFVGQGFGVEDALKAAIAAYNAGSQDAANHIKSDGLAAVIAAGTYAGKVLARAAFYASKDFDGASPKPALAAQTGMFVAANPEKFLGQSVPDGQCVAFVRAACNAPATAGWRKGALVRGNAAIGRGTAIATFDQDGRYGNHTDGRSHAAVYIEQNGDGLIVLDQWKAPAVQPVHKRTIRFGGHLPVNDGDQFFIVM